MRLRTRIQPFPGEKLVEVLPPLASFVEDAPLRRLNFFPGRHLTDVALKLEQAVRVARLRLRAEGVAPGVVTGLEAGLGADERGSFVEIGTGYGLTAAGEDVMVDRVLRVYVADLPVFTPGQDPFQAPKLSTLPIGETGPTAGVLVLVPGQVEEIEVPLAAKATGLEAENFQPFVRQPADEAYYRQSTVDAARLALLLWSADWPAAWRLPPVTAPGLWRNQVAWRVFAAEQAILESALLTPDEARAFPPWESSGVAVALLGLDEHWLPLFLDRHAVARQGGLPRQRVLATRSFARQLQGTGEPRLWQARIDQFAAELAEYANTAAGATRFRFLPPFGVLPKAYAAEWNTVTVTDPATEKATTYRTVRNTFFPANYAVQLAVAPLEQLDAVADATRGLPPFNLDQPDRVMLLAPVPQSVFDPQLLEVPEVAQELRDAVATLTADRNRTRGERDDYRARAGKLAEKTDGSAGVPAYPDPDPDQLDPAETAAGYTPPVGEIFGTTGVGASLAVPAFDKLKADLQKRYAAWTETPEQAGLGTYYPDQKAIKDREFLATDSAFAQGLRPFVRSLESKVNRAEEMIGTHYLRVRTDVYRLGQFVSGATLTTRFATSDALANVVERQTAAVDAKGLTAFASQLIGNLPDTRAAAGTKSGPPAAGTVKAAAKAPAAGAAAAEYMVYQPLDVQLTTNDQGNITAASVDSQQIVNVVKQDLLANKSLFQLNTIEPSFGKLPINLLKKLPLERLQPPAAVQIRKEINDGKLELFSKLQALDLCLLGLTTQFVDQPAAGVAYRALRLTEVFLQRGSDDDLGVPPADAAADQKNTEAAHFSRGVKHADLSIAALRAIEERIREYREIIDLARQALGTIDAQSVAVAAKLHEVDGRLAEARQDAAVAQALVAEEEARVAGVNEHRNKVLTEHVSFFVFHRPRALDTRIDRPVRTVYPALTESPVPAALREDLDVPPDLLALQEVFRDSPARWFRFAPTWLGAFDRLEPLRGFVSRVLERSAGESRATPTASTGRYNLALQTLFTSRAAVAVKQRELIQALPVATVAAASWQDLKREAQDRFSLGHFIDHGPALLARPAAEELQNVFKIAAAVHRDFSRTPALLRLGWAERYSQFDQAASFRDLAALPRWNEVEFTLRRELQLLADWLYARINTRVAEAVALMDDLVRVCLLLASHAPVDQLVTGTVAEPTTPTLGGLIRVRVDASRLRLGMGVVVDLGENQLVRAVVDNLAASEATARVTALSATGAPAITASHTVRFLDTARSF